MALITACLIVRDEADRIAGCLASLAGLVDEVVVHDTGSTDDTIRLAQSQGAVVVEGAWTDSFAVARNTALDAAAGTWILSVDADEIVHADPVGLRTWLSQAADRSLLVVVDNPVVDGAQGYRYTTVKLFRREGARWRGRVHERVVHDGLDDVGLRVVPAGLLRFEHSGYADEGAQRRKGERNGRLAFFELGDRMNDRTSTPQDIALAALNVGRSAVGAGQRQRAVDAFESVRELVQDGPIWNEATDHLARVLLGAGEAELGIVLADQLQANGVDPRYCSWIRAQGLAQRGQPQQALAQLHGLDEIVDTAGRHHDPAALEDLRVLCRELLVRVPGAGPP